MTDNINRTSDENTSCCQNCFKLKQEIRKQNYEWNKKHLETVAYITQQSEQFENFKRKEKMAREVEKAKLELENAHLKERINRYEREKIKQSSPVNPDAMVQATQMNSHEKKELENEIMALTSKIMVLKKDQHYQSIFLDANNTEIRTLEGRLREEKTKTKREVEHYKNQIKDLYKTLERKNNRISKLESMSATSIENGFLGSSSAS